MKPQEGFKMEKFQKTYYQQCKKRAVQNIPQRPIMPTFLAEGNEWHGDGGYLEHETLSDYIVE